MSSNSSEDYLDQLLNSFTTGGSSADEKKNTTENTHSEESDLKDNESKISMDEDYFIKEMDRTMSVPSAKDEEEFLREFEASLLEDDSPSMDLDSFNVELEASKNRDLDVLTGEEVDQSQDLSKDFLEPEAAIQDVIMNLKDVKPEEIQMEDIEGAAEELQLPPEAFASEELHTETPVMEESQAMTSEKADEDVPLSDDIQLDGMEETNISEGLQNPEPLKLTEDGEGDLTGLSDDDLMDLLANSADLSDIGDILQQDGSLESVDGSDAIGEFAQKEMQHQEEASSSETLETDKNEKKPGFFAKLKKLLFGSDEDEKNVVEISSSSTGTDVETLADENAAILAQLEQTEPEKKNEKKPKKEKPPKEKKPKKEKAPKVKKEKKPKPVDNTPPLPKGPVILSFIFVLSLTAFVYLCPTLLTYTSSLNQAHSLFENEKYVEAYQKIAGSKAHKSDEEFYSKAKIMAAVDFEYQNYLRYIEADNQTQALDALICAQGRCDVNADGAKTVSCDEELEKLQVTIAQELQNRYAMSIDEARELYSKRSRDEYTIALMKKLNKLGLN